MRIGDRDFGEVWAVDFEFQALRGECPVPICMVGHELVSGRRLRLWQDDLQRLSRAPFPVSDDTLVVAYYVSAEMGCFLALGWVLPVNILDLYVEFRNLTNGRPTPCGAGLLGALAYYGLDGIATTEKESMRQLALRGEPFTEGEREALLDYCETDVNALARLLPRMEDAIDLPRALLRGRYMAAVAHIERAGVPIDVPMLQQIQRNWDNMRRLLIEEVDRQYGVYEGQTFKAARWAAWLAANGIPWPVTPMGALALDSDTFREMARAYPAVAPMHELRATLGQLRLNDLAVGADGRNRTMLSAFRSRTGRNQPSNTAFIFGPAVWIRGLILAPPGSAVAYIDYSQQEFGIAAALSGDEKMMAAYNSGDPYLAFAKQTGAVPADATKKTHGSTRNLYKACVLAVQYGMGADALAIRIGQSPAVARALLRQHRETYEKFWRWSEAAVNHAMLRGHLPTVFGWTIHTAEEANPRSLANFPMQGNGSEMLRLACIFGIGRGVRIAAPVHDAVFIEAPAAVIEDHVAAMQQAMGDASAVVLGGFRLRTDVKTFVSPQRYMDERGEYMWDTVQGLLAQSANVEPVPA